MLPDASFEFAMAAPTQVTCKGCGSVYERRTHEVMVRVQDEDHCVVCGKLLERWDTNHIVAFRLVRKKKPKPKRVA